MKLENKMTEEREGKERKEDIEGKQGKPFPKDKENSNNSILKNRSREVDEEEDEGDDEDVDDDRSNDASNTMRDNATNERKNDKSNKKIGIKDSAKDEGDEENLEEIADDEEEEEKIGIPEKRLSRKKLQKLKLKEIAAVESLKLKEGLGDSDEVSIHSFLNMFVMWEKNIYFPFFLFLYLHYHDISFNNRIIMCRISPKTFLKSDPRLVLCARARKCCRLFYFNSIFTLSSLHFSTNIIFSMHFMIFNFTIQNVPKNVPTERTKTCAVCKGEDVLLFRCQWDASKQWRFVCTSIFSKFLYCTNSLFQLQT